MNWIPVSKSLPPHGHDVLVRYVEEGSTHVEVTAANLCPTGLWENLALIVEPGEKGDDEYACAQHALVEGTVTHWMPYPSTSLEDPWGVTT